jgi:hypothetical protein
MEHLILGGVFMSANIYMVTSLLAIAESELKVPLPAVRCLVFGADDNAKPLIERLEKETAACIAAQDEQDVQDNEKPFDLIYLFHPMDPDVLRKAAAFDALVVNAALTNDWIVRDADTPFRIIRVLALTQRGMRNQTTLNI